MWGICRPTLCFVLCRRLLSFHTCASHELVLFLRSEVCCVRVWESERKDLLALLRPPEHRCGVVLSEGSAAEQHVRHLPACGEYADQPCVSFSADAFSLSTLAPLTNSSCFSVARFAVCASGRASGKTSSPCFVLLSTGVVLSEGSAAEQHVRHLPACGEYADQPCVSFSADAFSLSTLGASHELVLFLRSEVCCVRVWESERKRPPRLASSS